MGVHRLMSEEINLTEALYNEVRRNKKVWNKNSVMVFYRKLLGRQVTAQFAIDALVRVSKLDCIITERINGVKHIRSEVSSDARKCLNMFLYER